MTAEMGEKKRAESGLEGKIKNWMMSEEMRRGVRAQEEQNILPFPT